MINKIMLTGNKCLKFCLAISILFFGILQTSAFAQGSATNYLPPYTTPQQGALPPPGSGPNSADVTPGNQGNSPPVPTNEPTAAPISGTYFAHEQLSVKPHVNLLVDDRGATKVALTFRPDQFTETQLSEVEGVIKAGSLFSGNSYQNIKVSTEQLNQIQEILYPYPGTTADAVPMRDGRERSFINQDIRAAGLPALNPSSSTQSNGSVDFNTSKPDITSQMISQVRKQAPRACIRQFCRYLVILGVVCGCILLALASTGIIMGHRDAGAKAISVGAGLMLLMMAYSIWKVVMFNTWNARFPQIEVVDLNYLQPELPSRPYPYESITMRTDPSGQQSSPPNAILPQQVPNNVPAGQPRPGLTLLPLGAQH